MRVPPSPIPFIDLLPARASADAAALQLSEDLRRLRPQVPLLHHPRHARTLVSRPAHAVLREAEKLVEAGVKELLVISQDTSAYGTEARPQPLKGRDEKFPYHRSGPRPGPS
jgi:ribosomal protein S12 methylthiotransferase